MKILKSSHLDHLTRPHLFCLIVVINVGIHADLVGNVEGY
jgi:hypothetical protein